MSDKVGLVFVDTNVLVYAHDNSQVEKQAVARELLEELWESRRGRMSIQVLQEFYNVGHRKLPNATSTDLQNVIRLYADWVKHSPSPQDVLTAIDLHQRYKMSFWDAMIMNSATVLGCDRIASEDLNTGQTINGVLIFNPFLQD